MFLLSACKVLLCVQHDEWILLLLSRSHFLASWSRVESSWNGVGECTSPDFPRRLSCYSPLSGVSRIRVDVLGRCSLPKIIIVPSATVNMKFPPLCSVITSFALSLRVWSSDASISCNSSMSATIMSPFQIHSTCNAYPRNIPGKTQAPNWCSLDWSFAEIGWYSTVAPNGINAPLQSIPNRL